MKITHHDKYMDYEKQGWLERLEHVELVKEGHPCYLVMCRVRDPQAFDREIEDFNRKEVFVAGKCIETSAETEGLIEIAVELVDRLPVLDAKTAIEKARIDAHNGG